MDDKEYFNPGIVDEQIDALLQTGSHPNEETRTVHDLQGLYGSDCAHWSESGSAWTWV